MSINVVNVKCTCLDQNRRTVVTESEILSLVNPFTYKYVGLNESIVELPQ